MDAITGAVVIAGLKYAGAPVAGVVKEFLGKVLAPPGTALGEIAAHPIVEWQRKRVERANRLVLAAAEAVQDAGAEPKSVPPQLFIPLLEKGSLADEEDRVIYEAWVGLLAQSAIEAGKVLPAYVSILAELTSLEAQILTYLHKYALTWNDLEDIDKFPLLNGRRDPNVVRLMNEISTAIQATTISQQLGTTASEEAIRLAIENLSRLALIDGTTKGDTFRFRALRGKYEMTMLGMGFMRACTKPPKV